MALMLEALLAAVSDVGRYSSGECDRADKALERPSPERLSRLQIALTEPRNVVSVRTRAFQLELPMLGIRLIEFQHFLDHQIDAPSVKEAMMKAPVKIVRVVRDANKKQTHQGRLVQVEATL